MDHISVGRWRQACSALGVADCERQYAKVVRAWTSLGRHYHTIEHLAACLQELDGARMLAERPAESELALWYHDAVYRTYRKDNEAKSAAWAARFLGSNGASADAVARVQGLMLATAHRPDQFARSRILQSFLSRPTIYHYPYFIERYEAAARRNLERAIGAL